ncbi:MAG TPA: DNA-directed RNA polymerase subunit omega [Candidatus Desulfofervidus auxilii]|uniref:DNA-directed RNA polymerase subunit omega n=1 Tax=Desulfofervidus auxilii TaxID=1621989 RepID=A0A7V0NEN5_DESA2|nr:MAG: DNA-directed RNA polymerase subunit omega [Candidatus Pacearchaeota archaeon]HDD35722.1 DNA-directed RNA polymerase subunit omega [Candidatus Desulfofervidus auxilii]
MARVTVEDCLKKVPSRFKLIHLAIQRVKQLREGNEPLIECNNKEIVVALREIAAGLITPENIKELDKKEKITSPYEISEILKQRK